LRFLPVKKATPGAAKKVTAENLAGLGAERLAEILVGVAATRADLKRRLRMELAATQGAGPLVTEIDKRLSAFETSRGKVTWRQAPAFIRDVDALRELIAERLAPHDAEAAVERLWRLLAAARPLSARYRERDTEFTAIFTRAAAALGALLAHQGAGPSTHTLVEAAADDPSHWKIWLPALLAHTSVEFARDALRLMRARRGAPAPGRITLLRQLADAAHDPDAYAEAWSFDALKTANVAAEVAARYLAAHRADRAGEVLASAAPRRFSRGVDGPDYLWESVQIAYLDESGRAAAAQALRWASFERTLSPDRARDFIARLADFDDVDAEMRAFETAARFPAFETGLQFLMAWPALAEAAAMIMQRDNEIDVDAEAAELWAAKLRRRHPDAAKRLLTRTAALAFRRRDFQTCDRLVAEAETIVA
jgi:hypothetical protein